MVLPDLILIRSNKEFLNRLFFNIPQALKYLLELRDERPGKVETETIDEDTISTKVGLL